MDKIKDEFKSAQFKVGREVLILSRDVLKSFKKQIETVTASGRAGVLILKDFMTSSPGIKT
jgi:hypothetical protein